MIMLDQTAHARILADFEHICRMAGIQGHFLYESMGKICKEAEIDWVKNYWTHKKEGCNGLVLHGITRPDTRCQLITAALVRNFIDARVIPVNTLLEKETDPTAPSVLVIPNLYMSILSKSTPAWKVQELYDMLLTRAIRGKPSVVYVENLSKLKQEYGAPFEDFLMGFKQATD